MNWRVSADAVAAPSATAIIETDEYTAVLGSARPLLEALQHATTEMLTWLTEDYGFDERSASMLMGEAADIEVANIVDPNYTVVTKIRKVFLPRR